MRNTHRKYRLVRPPDDNYRPETCPAVQCPAYLKGWVSAVDLSSDLGQRQAAYIRTLSGRAFTEETPGRFYFEAGQSCFQTHWVRQDIFLADQRLHTRGVDWVEDLAEHQDLLAKEIANG